MEAGGRHIGRLAWVALAVLGAAACGDEPNPVICTAIAVSALTVTVVDAATNQPICDAEVTATGRRIPRDATRCFRAAERTAANSGPLERPGTYEVTVRRAGYPTAVQSNIRVTSDECHVIGVPVTIRLDRAALTPQVGDGIVLSGVDSG